MSHSMSVSVLLEYGHNSSNITKERLSQVKQKNACTRGKPYTQAQDIGLVINCVISSKNACPPACAWQKNESKLLCRFMDTIFRLFFFMNMAYVVLTW